MSVSIHKAVVNTLVDVVTTGPSIGYLVGQRTTGEVSINSCIRCTSDNILHDIDVAQQLLPAGMIGRWRDGNILVHYEKDHDRCNRRFDSCVVSVMDSENHWLHFTDANSSVTICGLFGCSQISPTVQGLRTLFSASLDTLCAKVNTGDLVVCHCNNEQGSEIEDNFFIYNLHQKSLSKIRVTVHEDDIFKKSVLLRLKCDIPLSFDYNKEENEVQKHISKEIEDMCYRIESRSTVFHILRSTLLLRNYDKDEDGSEDLDTPVSSLYDFIQTEEEGELSSKKKKKTASQQIPIKVKLLSQCTGDTGFDLSPMCAPFIQHKIGAFESVDMMLPIDVVGLVAMETSLRDLPHLLCNGICQQLKAMVRCLCHYRKGSCFPQIHVYHFRPQDVQTYVTVVYPEKVTDKDLESTRRQLHDRLTLPADRPLFRRRNAYPFPDETTGGYLINPHIGLQMPSTSGGKISLVQGVYAYHHYMQDRFNDDKWGCAYRSLQTLSSWFRYQGYTDKPVPTHKEIQQILVNIGDKEPSFVGSRKWIGSMEVSFVLDELFGIVSKILSVSCGSELASRGRDLSHHFKTQGSPIMIGGGVLAHTILGVDFNEVTGDTKFLILDPHYTGAEDLKVIQDKGWCGWKSADFWDKSAHYNMCMPQRPNMI